MSPGTEVFYQLARIPFWLQLFLPFLVLNFYVCRKENFRSHCILNLTHIGSYQLLLYIGCIFTRSRNILGLFSRR
jgi:hypothetical protein